MVPFWFRFVLGGCGTGPRPRTERVTEGGCRWVQLHDRVLVEAADGNPKLKAEHADGGDGATMHDRPTERNEQHALEGD